MKHVELSCFINSDALVLEGHFELNFRGLDLAVRAPRLELVPRRRFVPPVVHLADGCAVSSGRESFADRA